MDKIRKLEDELSIDITTDEFSVSDGIATLIYQAPRERDDFGQVIIDVGNTLYKLSGTITPENRLFLRISDCYVKTSNGYKKAVLPTGFDIEYIAPSGELMVKRETLKEFLCDRLHIPEIVTTYLREKKDN